MLNGKVSVVTGASRGIGRAVALKLASLGSAIAIVYHGNSEKAEREVDDLWLTYLMKDHVGEVFDGRITSVTNFGVFVGLENSAEGLIKIEDLPGDGYLYFEKSLELKNQSRVYKIGDPIKVKLISANVFTRKIDFVPANT